MGFPACFPSFCFSHCSLQAAPKSQRTLRKKRGDTLALGMEVTKMSSNSPFAHADAIPTIDWRGKKQ